MALFSPRAAELGRGSSTAKGTLVRMEDGVIPGNVYNKYETRNPIARYLQGNFQTVLLQLIRSCGATVAHEIGCGEGYLSAFLHDQLGLRMRASDASGEIIRLARELHANSELRFVDRSVYDLVEAEDSAPLIVCCEVLEHLEHPGRALQVVQRLAQPYAIISTPREPVWRIATCCEESTWGRSEIPRDTSSIGRGRDCFGCSASTSRSSK